MYAHKDSENLSIFYTDEALHDGIFKRLSLEFFEIFFDFLLLDHCWLLKVSLAIQNSGGILLFRILHLEFYTLFILWS